jgi:hypothetical protein
MNDSARKFSTAILRELDKDNGDLEALVAAHDAETAKEVSQGFTDAFQQWPSSRSDTYTMLVAGFAADVAAKTGPGKLESSVIEAAINWRARAGAPYSDIQVGRLRSAVDKLLKCRAVSKR